MLLLEDTCLNQKVQVLNNTMFQLDEILSESTRFLSFFLAATLSLRDSLRLSRRCNFPESHEVSYTFLVKPLFGEATSH
jgi:hypothetical protein